MEPEDRDTGTTITVKCSTQERADSIMNSLTKLLLLSAICIAVIAFTAELAFGATDPATCAVSVTVSSTVEWDGDFAAIDLDAQEAAISAQAHSPEGSATITLWINTDTTLTADTTAAAQLEEDGAGTDTLTTKYKLSADGDGVATTGDTAASIAANGSDVYEVHSTFLTPGLAIVHIADDGATEVTLEVEATNPADEMANAGTYSATQTITATW